MILFPPCKINLGLHILNKRPDGYHNLDTLMYQVPLHDILELVKAEEFAFSTSGIQIPGDEDSNLCVKAFKLVQEMYQIPNVKIHLHKIIPMGGGLGGGSANASYVLLGLNEIFELQIPTKKLQKLAAELGSDCPLFIEKSPQIAQGRGDILSPFALDLNGYYVKLVNLGIHISTQEAFSKVEFYDHYSSVDAIIPQPIENWKSILKNDFEKSVFQYHPQLQEVKDKLYAEGAIYASMSGSGSTMFGIFKNEPELSFGDAIFEKVLMLK